MEKTGGKRPRPRDIQARVGRYLQLARMELDPNRTRFAAQFGVHHTLWAKWEKGENYPDPAVMVRLCEEYGLTMDYLYRGILAYMPNERLKLQLAAKPELAQVAAETGQPEGTPAPKPADPPEMTYIAKPLHRSRTAKEPAV